MRIAIYDGILEHHVHESLERALLSRGHAVLATGKIGHGFRFPAPGASVAHLERAVASVMAFEPDWVIVMRPASLPVRLLQRLREQGARLAAWFSDDPVLFDLSYAPVVEQYDRILHCGARAVLEHYEGFFGRPTGVNIPFWTDHVAFPAVWGEEAPESRAMFLGNVHDEVRRRRYFDLARFGDDVRIHGKIGSDYAKRDAGYLDTDAEVVAAGARTDWAINIPQWFRDHEGLETWFPGLGELGFFEYPSRVVQTMAMGIPTITVIDGGYEFETYPEMLVASSIDEAIDIARDPSWNRTRLADHSRSVLQRFNRHFSATARAVAIERFLLDDGWMTLDLDARARWFADAADAVAASAESAQVPAEPGRQSITIADDRALPRRAMVAVPPSAGPLSRARAVVEALQALGIAVREVRSDQPELDLASDHADGIEPVDAVLVVDLPTQPAPSTGGAARTVLIADLDAPTAATASIVASYDLVGLTSPSAVERFRDAGFDHVVLLPRLVTPSFARAVEAAHDRGRSMGIRVASSAEAENRLVPGLAEMLTGAGLALVTWDELAELGPTALAEAVVADAGVLTPRGSRSAPQLDDLFVHVRAAVRRAMMPRSPGLADVPGLVGATPQFASPAELGRKAWRLDTSARWGASIDAASGDLRRASDAVAAVSALLRAPAARRPRGYRLRSEEALLAPGAACDIPFDELSWDPRSILRVSARGHSDARAALDASVTLDGEPIWMGRCDSELRLVVAAPRSARARLRLRLEYRGVPQTLTPEVAYEIDASILQAPLPLPLHASAPVRVLELSAAQG